MVESGSMGINAGDAALFLVNDANLPDTLFQATDKLKGWSCVADVYLGADHRLAVALRGSIRNVTSYIHGFQTYYMHDPSKGVLMASRVMYWYQQTAFLHLLKLREGGGADTALPDYDSLLDSLRSKMHEGFLPKLPQSWLEKKKQGGDEGKGKKGGDEQSTGAHRNSRPNRDLMKRFQKAEDSTIKDILDAYTGEGTVTMPKCGSEEVCLR